MTFKAQLVSDEHRGDEANLGVHVFEHIPRVADMIVMPSSAASHGRSRYVVREVHHWPLEDGAEPRLSISQDRPWTTIVVSYLGLGAPKYGQD